MDSLPPELLRYILLETVYLCRCDKNELLPLRRVCKAFDSILKEYLFKTVQLEFSRFARNQAAPDPRSITNVGYICESLYCDMMVIRDEEEIDRLLHVFKSIIKKVPEMIALLDSLRQYCMNEHTFDETDFKRVMDSILFATPNLVRLKLNLPFQVIGQASRTATILLATMFACIARRPDEFRPLETLVLDHVSDSTILDICQNPIDLSHTLKTFKGLRNLVLSIKRQEHREPLRVIFANRLWLLISEAAQLESLCIIGWNTKRSSGSRRHRGGIDLDDWRMKSLPYPTLDARRTLKQLRFLELKRLDIDATALLSLIRQNSTSLKELYLYEVYLKVLGSVDQDKTALWIGHGNDVPKPPEACWIAESLRDMDCLTLDILRATGLGYDDYQPDRRHEIQPYDLVDPSGLGRSFDERFVEVVLGVPQPALKSTTLELPLAHVSHTNSSEHNLTAPVDGSGGSSPLRPLLGASEEDQGQVLSFHSSRLRKIDYDAETFQRHHNTTSHWKRCIDGLFYNHNEKALGELQKIIGVADRGMTLLSDEIDRLHSITHISQDEV